MGDQEVPIMEFVWKAEQKPQLECVGCGVHACGHNPVSDTGDTTVFSLPLEIPPNCVSFRVCVC